MIRPRQNPIAVTGIDAGLAGLRGKGKMSEADTQDNGQGTFDLTISVSHLLHRAQQLAANESAAALREAGITLRQFNVLAAASQEDGPSQSRLVELTGIDRSTLADMLNRSD